MDEDKKAYMVRGELWVAKKVMISPMKEDEMNRNKIYMQPSVDKVLSDLHVPPELSSVNWKVSKVGQAYLAGLNLNYNTKLIPRLFKASKKDDQILEFAGNKQVTYNPLEAIIIQTALNMPSGTYESVCFHLFHV
ncbi:hypothetical protein EIN_016440 [Entamoeba invadens IP1]|uniref:hypothetical protein n=1 Tax=Entamoeba invadens IP1 TaxID=370355 RepID=UPI0002C3D8EE|nr:hypothetical protein EIN_016440 [Entamoeba invadens IP1]ELP90425.1 hypothetical protein EIN_016440 [Entamoeba invadens IP1]|eukprot:XP_004257196.1 hypothetical protein EIN_016440 [Entamoeba invadens IP1]